MFYICRTIRRFFSLSSEVVHWSVEIQTKVYDPRKDWPSEWIRASSLNSYFAFCKIVLKKDDIHHAKRHLFEMSRVWMCIKGVLFLGLYITPVIPMLPAEGFVPGSQTRGQLWFLVLQGTFQSLFVKLTSGMTLCPNLDVQKEKKYIEKTTKKGST